MIRYASLSKTVMLGAALILAATLGACAESPPEQPPETERTTKAERTTDDAPRWMLAAANPLAVEAGAKVLAKGGSAVDAAIAVQAVLGLVEPQSSGIGGGAFALYWDRDSGTLYAYDGRETAPRAARPDLFLKEDGTPMGFFEAVPGGKSVGVPGVIAMLGLMHERHGRLPWAELFTDAVALAEDGFKISPRLARIIPLLPYTKQMPDTRAYFFDENGDPYPAGHVLKNPDYARTLRALAEGGAEAFYQGAIAEGIVQAVATAPVNAQAMTLEDIALYEPKTRDPLCAPYRDYTVCGMGPPTSGGVAVLQVLSFLARFDMAALEPTSAEAAHLIAEAFRLAFADRNLYLADTDYIDVPVAGLLDAAYLRARGALIDPAKSMGPAKPGNPRTGDPHLAPDTSPEGPGTSHFSIVDADGNALSVTTTVEFIFGSHLMTGGFFLNNQLTDFSFEPSKDGHPVANAVQPGKRPRSSMSPTIVFDKDGKPVLLVGSPGGSRIPGYTVRAILGVLDWGLSPQDAAALPHIINRNGTTDLEEGTDAAALKTALEALGHQITVRELTSGIHAIRIGPEGLQGGADPRREGTVQSGTLLQAD